MRKKLWCVMGVVCLMLMVPCAVAAAEKPEIVNHTAQVLDRALHLSLAWQSTNPVVRVFISAGHEQKQVAVTDRDNRRVAGGFSGELSVVVPVEANMFQKEVAYLLQVEDELHLKSDLVSGKAPVPAVAGHEQGRHSGDPWGKEYLNPDAGAALSERMRTVQDRTDLAPSVSNLKAAVLGPNTVLFTLKANDDKQLKEIIFRIFDANGTQAATARLTDLGRVWEGASPLFRLSGGSYRLTVQAFDSSGNSSQELSAAFALSGGPVSEQGPIASPAAPQPGGAVGDTASPATSPPPASDKPLTAVPFTPGHDKPLTPAGGASQPTQHTFAPVVPQGGAGTMVPADEARALKIVQDAKASGKTLNQAAALLKQSGVTSGSIVARVLQQVYRADVRLIGYAMKGAGYLVLEVASGIRALGVMYGDILVTMLQELGYGTADIVKGIIGVYQVPIQTLVNLLKGKGVSAVEIARALKVAYGSTFEGIARILLAALYPHRVIADALVDIGVTSAEELIRILRAAGFTVEEIATQSARILTETYRKSARVAAYTMQKAGIATRETVQALKNLGHNVGDIAEGLVDAGLESADDLATYLKDGGFGAKEVAKGLKKVGKGATAIAKALKHAGWSSYKTILDALKDAGFSSVATLKDALKAVGASLADLAELF